MCSEGGKKQGRENRAAQQRRRQHRRHRLDHGRRAQLGRRRCRAPAFLQDRWNKVRRGSSWGSSSSRSRQATWGTSPRTSNYRASAALSRWRRDRFHPRTGGPRWVHCAWYDAVISLHGWGHRPSMSLQMPYTSAKLQTIFDLA
jgi:hypothetical protein